MKEVDYKIIGEIQKILVKLGANTHILSAVGSWKDTLEDEQVLEELIEINKSDVLFNEISN